MFGLAPRKGNGKSSPKLVQAIVPVSRSEYHVSFDVKPDFVLMSPGGRSAHCWYESGEDRVTALV